MDRIEEMDIAIEAYMTCEPAIEIAIRPSTRKYKKLSSDKRVSEIIGQFFEALENEGVRIDKSGAAGAKLGKYLKKKKNYSPRATFASGSIGSVPVLIQGTGDYVDKKFWFCVAKSNGKPKIVKITVNTIAKVFNKELTAIEPERIQKYAKKLLQYVDDAPDDADDDSDIE